MKVEDFLKEAREKISPDPFTRVSPVTKLAIDNPDCIFDIHCHIFDRKCLSVLYIILRMARSAIRGALRIEANDDLSEQIDLLKMTDEAIYSEIANNLPETEDDWEKFEKELDAIQVLDKYEIFGYEWADLKQAITVLKKGSMSKVFELYTKEYGINNLEMFKGRPFVSGILMMDLATGWDMTPDKRLLDQIKELQNLSLAQAILPFFSIDPRRANLSDENENLYSLFLKAFTEGDFPFFGVKCYPALGYFPSDTRLEPIFQICEEKNIPVTTHCGGTIVSTFEKEIQICDSIGLKNYTLPGSKRTDRANFLNDPKHWDPVLQKHNKLKINFAHFGGDTNWEDINENPANERVGAIVSRLSDSALNVFTDFSFNVVEENLFQSLKTMMDTNPNVVNKTMFGTDFWVVLPSGNLLVNQEIFLNLLSSYREKMVNSNPRQFLFDKTYIN